MELLEKFGIDLGVLLAQSVNFLIVLGLLTIFAYRPLLKLLQDREKRIAKSLKDAEETHRALQAIEEQKKTILDRARSEADALLEQTMKETQQRHSQAIEQTKAAAHSILEKTKRELAERKTALVKEASADVADLIVLATENILRERLPKESTRDRIENIVRNLTSQRPQ